MANTCFWSQTNDCFSAQCFSIIIMLKMISCNNFRGSKCHELGPHPRKRDTLVWMLFQMFGSVVTIKFWAWMRAEVKGWLSLGLPGTSALSWMAVHVNRLWRWLGKAVCIMLKSATGTSCLTWWVCYGSPLSAHCCILSDILFEYI